MNDKLILLIEDNADDETLTLRALKKNRIMNDVMIVRDGAEALDFLFERGPYAARAGNPLPQVVFLDLKLPKVDGLEVLRQMRANKRTRAVPVVVLSSSSEERDIVESYELGANSYIRKPTDFARFAEAVRALGSYWLALNEPLPRRSTPPRRTE